MTKSTPAGFSIFLSDPDRSQNFLKTRTWTRSDFSISAVAGEYVVISEVKPLAIFDCLNGIQILNRSRIFKVLKFA